ncbi:YidC/Oxa1 family membrane protein insertase [Calderihabitans maritimus]|uniref:Preprotein translocase subunit YidC n=1 Tax=Calderihabitans maritimus TaxID=1246530 RepID=A0A1Z5HWJ8_9FIRM|nr:YidC/Oxa1 family membrane protein insertase [Calderihabitans maritimus]GAW93650.1 preprotein translocase subunit YidC [Calderihabitans maritimus]
MFSSLVDFISQSIQFFYIITDKIGIPNYGLAIILFTVAVKIILYPLTYKQMKAMRKMQELQPKVKEIQEKYKKNPQKSQEELMKLYKEHGANPFAGCWPLLIQMPILIALFRSLQVFFDPTKHPDYVNLAHAKFLWIDNLGNPDPLLLPILVGVTQYLQQKVTSPNIQDQTQKTMLYMMPIMLAVISRGFPAGLSLYWVVFSVVGAVQQIIINRQPLAVKEEVRAK